MFRILALVAIVIILFGGLGYWRFSASKNSLKSPTKQAPSASVQSDSISPIEVPATLPADATVEDKIKIIQTQLDSLNKQLSSLKPEASSSPRIDALEASVTEIKARLSLLEKGTTSSSTTASNKYPLYIPLGVGGSVTSSDWQTIDNYNITIDPASYPGYSGVQLEINMRLNDPKGIKAFARLINITDNSAITSSQATTTSTSFSTVSSGNFNLTTGSKSYKLQVKTQEQAELLIQDARLKVNF